jgi:type IV secretory pathway VirB10-like protein
MGNAATALAIVLSPEMVDDALQLFDEDQAQAFAKAAVRVQEIVARVPTGKIESDAQAREVETILSAGKTALKYVEDTRKAAVGPLNAQVSAINALYRPLTDSLESLKPRCEPLLLAHIHAKQEAQRKQELEAQRLRIEAEQRELAEREAAEAAKTEAERKAHMAAAGEAMQDAALAVATTPRQVKAVASEMSSHTVVKRWVVAGIDAAKLPREYLVPDGEMINAALAEAVRKMRAAGKQTPDFNIAGVTIEEKEGLKKGRGIY